MTIDEQFARISIDPTVAGGVAVIRGTRVPVSVVLNSLAEGLSPEEISLEYPNVSTEDVREACAYGAALARENIWKLALAE